MRYFERNPRCNLIDVLEKPRVEGDTWRGRSLELNKKGSSNSRTGRAVLAIEGYGTGNDSSDSSAGSNNYSPHLEFIAATIAMTITGNMTTDYGDETACVFATTYSGYTKAKFHGNLGWPNRLNRNGTQKRRFTRPTDV